MIKQLRKRHLQIWTILLFGLPVIIISGWLAIKRPVTTQSLLQPLKAEILPVVVKSIDNENYTANLRTNKERSALQLEWINKSPIKTPSALIYRSAHSSRGDTNQNEIIGRIDSRGSYFFALKNDTASNNRFILYDFIHRQIIDSLNF